MNKAAITRLLEQLRPERVERGLEAFTQTCFDDVWAECFLGRAVGMPRGANSAVIIETLRSFGDYTCITHTFDKPELRPALRALVEEWLEANRVAPEAPHVPMSRVPVPV